jgi:membrane protein
MVNLWILGGLSWREIIRRTWKESWADEVFGQAARLAFYHFLALFPALMLALLLLGRFPHAGPGLIDALKASLDSVLPASASTMVDGVMKQMGDPGARGGLLFAVLGSMWAAFNGTWAVMSGLNDAYEVTEERPWWKVTLVAAGLTVAQAALVLTALVALSFGRHVFGVSVWWQLVRWTVLAVLLLVTFALYYRFGPDLSDMRWRWSTPGAVVAAVLWVGATLLFRFYVHHSPGKYEQAYGSVAAGAILLLWFYITGATILIGGEMNSQIENAAAQGGHPDARRPGERRQGGREPARAKD